MTNRLSDEAVAQFHREGYFLIEDALDASTVAMLREESALAVEWQRAAMREGRPGVEMLNQLDHRYFIPRRSVERPRLRELVLAIRAIWTSWQTGERLNFRGHHYKLTLMTPFFNPGPIAHPDIPIYLSGVNTGLARLAGEVADGFHVHPFHTAGYLRDVVRVALAEGRGSHALPTVSATAFVVTNDAERESVREQIAFYASTPSYRPVLELHGWGPLQEELHALSKRGEWGAMGERISDEMLATFAAVGAPEEIPAQLHARYGGIADRLMLVHYTSLEGEARERWRAMLAAIRR